MYWRQRCVAIIVIEEHALTRDDHHRFTKSFCLLGEYCGTVAETGNFPYDHIQAINF